MPVGRRTGARWQNAGIFGPPAKGRGGAYLTVNWITNLNHAADIKKAPH